MGSLIVYNSDEACILYIKKRNYIYLAIEGFLNSEKTKAFYKSMVDICRKKNITRILFDTSKLGTIKEDDLQWIFKEAAEAITPINIKKISFVSPQNSFGKWTISRIFTGFKDLNAKVLDSIEEAENWLFEDVGINS